MNSWNLNFLEPSGLLQACNGNALPFYIDQVKGFVWHCICFWCLKKNMGLETQTKVSSKQIDEKFQSAHKEFLNVAETR
jgi:hypothetical protein